MQEKVDIAIVGAGPAGAYCAYKLACQGLKPVIFDNSHPREKPCGGGISPLAIEKFPFLQKLSSKGKVTSNFKLIFPDDRVIVTKQPHNGFNISRRILDLSILTMAQERGAQLIEKRVISVKKANDAWVVKANGQEMIAKTLVGADGVNSLVRQKLLGPISTQNLGLCFGYFVTCLDADYNTMKFLEGLSGYIWIFPRDVYASFGIGSKLENGASLKGILDSFITSNYPKVKILSRFCAMVPWIKDPAFFDLPCSGTNWVLIGDAAGHVNPLTGEGIFYALWSAELAAKALVDNKPMDFDVFWREEFGNSLKQAAEQRIDTHFI